MLKRGLLDRVVMGEVDVTAQTIAARREARLDSKARQGIACLEEPLVALVSLLHGSADAPRPSYEDPPGPIGRPGPA